MSAPDHGQQLGATDRSSSVFSLLRMILGSRKFKALAVAGWLGYWLLYAFSIGMFFYYSSDITSLLKTSPVLPNPYFLKDFSSFFGFYNSGMIWYPNGHLQVNLLYGPLIFSVVLSTLFSLNIVLTVFSIRFTHLSRGSGSVGVLALIPALFSGGCCSVPFGLALIGIFAPTVGLTTLVYDYPYLINLAFVILMLLSLFYVGRRLVRITIHLRVENEDALSTRSS
jgi:hypothetical protein